MTDKQTFSANVCGAEFLFGTNPIDLQIREGGGGWVKFYF